MPEVEVEVTSSIARWRRAAERVTARGRRSTWPSSLVNCHRVRPAPCRTICDVARAQHSESGTQQALGGATSAQLPNVLAQCAAARWRLTGTARRRRPRQWALN